MTNQPCLRVVTTAALVAAAFLFALRSAVGRPRSAANERTHTTTPTAQPDSWSLNGGLFDALPLPRLNNNDLYAFAGGTRLIPRGRFILAPGLGVEMAPASRRWGLVATLTVDLPVTERIGIDLAFALLTDQPGGHFGQAVFAGGIGPGVSITRGAWTISPSVSVFNELNGSRQWILVPALQLSRNL